MTEVVIADPIRNLLLMGMLNQVQHDGVLFSMTKAVIAGSFPVIAGSIRNLCTYLVNS